MYQVHTCLLNLVQDKGAFKFLRLKEHILFKLHTSTYWYVPHTYLFAQTCTALLSFLKSTSVYILTLSEYIFWVPAVVLLCACLAQPVCLPAIQAPPHTFNQITPKHWQVYSLLLSSTIASACTPGSQLHQTHYHHEQLSAQPPGQPATQCALQMGMWRTWASRWGVDDDLQKFKQSCQAQRFNQRDIIVL